MFVYFIYIYFPMYNLQLILIIDPVFMDVIIQASRVYLCRIL